MEQKKNTDSTFALRFLAFVGMGMFWIIRMMLKAIAWTAFSALGLMDGSNSSGKRRKSVAAKVTDQPQAGSNLGQEHKVVGEYLGQQSEFKAADRILTIRLDPSVAVLYLRVHNDERLVERELIVTEPRLKALLQGRRHTFAAAKFDPSIGFDEIMEETVELAQTLINAKGNLKVKQTKTSVNVKPTPQDQPKAVEQVSKKPVAKTDNAPKPVAAMPKPKSSEPATQSARSYVPTPAVGVAFEGDLVAAGSRRMNPKGRPSYEVFEAKVHVGNGVDVPLRGAELERELERLGIQLGERVSITPMGKVPVSLGEGKEGTKNVYRVARL